MLLLLLLCPVCASRRVSKWNRLFSPNLKHLFYLSLKVTTSKDAYVNIKSICFISCTVFLSGHRSRVYSARSTYYTVMVIFLGCLSIGATPVTMGHMLEIQISHDFFCKCDNVCRHRCPPYCISTNTFIDLNKRTSKSNCKCCFVVVVV